MGYHDAFRELEDMSTRLNRLLTRQSSASGTQDESMAVAQWAPSVDIVEINSEFQIRAEVPGVEKQDINVSVHDGVLLIAGHRQQEKEEQGHRYHRTECLYGSFARSFRLPDSIDEQKLTAEFRNGVLTIHLPKSERATPKSIDLKVS